MAKGTKYKCSNCGTFHVTMRGQCHFCKMWNCISENEIVVKKYVMPKQSVKKRIENAKAKLEGNDELKDWFLDRKAECLKSNTQCLECNRDVINDLISEEIWIARRCHAHILPKKTFESVKTNPNNHILLCWQCHHDYDSNWDKAKKMKVFKIAVEKSKLFINQVMESMTKIPDEFSNYV